MGEKKTLIKNNIPNRYLFTIGFSYSSSFLIHFSSGRFMGQKWGFFNFFFILQFLRFFNHIICAYLGFNSNKHLQRVGDLIRDLVSLWINNKMLFFFPLMLLKDQGSTAPSLPERLHHVFHCDPEWHHPLPHPAAARGQGGPAALHLLCKFKKYNPLTSKSYLSPSFRAKFKGLLIRVAIVICRV